MQDGCSGVVDKEESLMRKVCYLQRSESLLPSKVSPLLLPQHTPTAPLPSKRKSKSFSWSPPLISLQGYTQEVSFFFAIANGNSGLIDFRLFFFFFSSPFLLSETLLSWNGPQIFSFPAPRQWMVLGSGTSLISSYKAREWIPRH